MINRRNFLGVSIAAAASAALPNDLIKPKAAHAAIINPFVELKEYRMNRYENFNVLLRKTQGEAIFVFNEPKCFAKYATSHYKSLKEAFYTKYPSIIFEYLEKERENTFIRTRISTKRFHVLTDIKPCLNKMSETQNQILADFSYCYGSIYRRLVCAPQGKEKWIEENLL